MPVEQVTQLLEQHGADAALLLVLELAYFPDPLTAVLLDDLILDA